MKKKLFYNTASSLVLQIITIICGFILPRQILKYYGSDVNGLISSITQFLSFISFLQLGVGAVAQSEWYKPLAEKNNKKISEIYLSTQLFFRKISYIFIIYVIFLCIVYPFKVLNDFSQIYTITLILSISINLFLQYFLGITNQLLLYADQNAYIYMVIQGVLLIINTFASIVLMRLGLSIQVVKLISSLTFSINPIILMFFVNKKYEIDKKIKYLDEPLKQKWNGFAQHISSVITDNTDVVILTLFSTLKNVSIYYVYHMVVYGIRQLVTSAGVGIQSAFGNLIATKKNNELNVFFDKVEIIFHFAITFLFSCTTILITKFVFIYTRGINDANYIVPTFAFIMCVTFAIYCYRIPYNTIIKAAGHYKETQGSAIIESVLNVVISTILVINFGLIGVAIGTFIAVFYRLIYFVIYLSNNIIKRKVSKFIKLIFIDICVFIVCICISKYIAGNCINYIDFFVECIKTSILTIIITFFMFFMFENKKMFAIINKSKKMSWNGKK